MVMAGWSVQLTRLFSLASLNKRFLPVLCTHTFACNWYQPFLNESAKGRRMTVEIISWSISTKVWDQAQIELVTPGSAVRYASLVRQITHCTMGRGMTLFTCQCMHWIEKPLNIVDFLEKTLKNKSALKSTRKLLLGLEKSLNFTIFCGT